MISVVVPLFDEGPNVDCFVKRAEVALGSCDDEYELVLVDDGSSDATWDRITEASRRSGAVRGVKLSRNFGHQGALLAGLTCARGNPIVTMDGDLQHPPELLPTMVAAWRNGARVVLMQRIDGQVTPKLKRVSSRLFYRMFSLLAETRIEPGSSDFRLLDRQVLEQLLQLRFGVPFLRGAVQTLGFPTATLPYEVGRRAAGSTKYTPAKMLSLGGHGLISHSSAPLRLGLWLGGITFALSVAELAYVVITHAIGRTVPGWASTVGITSLFFGALFLLVGILGLYIEDIHRLLKQQPHFIVAETVGPHVEAPPRRPAGTDGR